MNEEQEEYQQQEGKVCLARSKKFRRLPKHIYYVGTTEDGYLELWQAPSGRKKNHVN